MNTFGAKRGDNGNIHSIKVTYVSANYFLDDGCIPLQLSAPIIFKGYHTIKLNTFFGSKNCILYYISNFQLPAA